MPPHVIEQLDRTISEVFALMLNRDCNPTENCSASEFAHAAEAAFHPDSGPGIVASISFSGALRGTCSIHLPLRTATAITGELLGPMPFSDAADLNADTAGEICNMIAGSWKSRQPNPHASCALSTPQVTQTELRHESLTPTHPSTFRNILVRTYTFEDHCLHLQLGFD